MFWMWVARIFLVPLAVFELLNALGILHQPLTFTWWGLVVTSLPVWAVLELAHQRLKKIKKNIPWWVIVPVILAAYFDALGDAEGVYNTFYWFDQVAHCTGSMAATAFVGAILFPFWKVHRLSQKVSFIFLVTCGAALGVVYELAEYLEDIISESHRLGDGYDTANDLLWDVFGAVVVAALIPRLIQNYHDRRNHTSHQEPT